MSDTPYRVRYVKSTDETLMRPSVENHLVTIQQALAIAILMQRVDLTHVADDVRVSAAEGVTMALEDAWTLAEQLLHGLPAAVANLKYIEAKDDEDAGV